jgi:hypothetical protein
VAIVKEPSTMRICAIVTAKNLTPELVHSRDAVVQFLPSDVDDEFAATNRTHKAARDLVFLEHHGLQPGLCQDVGGRQARRAGA